MSSKGKKCSRERGEGAISGVFSLFFFFREKKKELRSEKGNYVRN